MRGRNVPSYHARPRARSPSTRVRNPARSGMPRIFRGLPLLAGDLTRGLGERARGRAWYEGTFLPRIGPIALYGLLFTVVVLFALQGETITSEPLDVVRIAIPLLAYFALMWVAGFWVGRVLKPVSYTHLTLPTNREV